MKRLWIVIVLIIIVIGGYVFLLSRSSNGSDTTSSSNSGGLLYFWSITCPHCKNVAAFLESYSEKDKIVLDKKEVSENRDNARLLSEKAASCNIPSNQVGIPLLVTKEGECLSGDTPIIDYLKKLFPESTTSALPNSDQSTVTTIPNQ
jgi:hypothetical protein